MLMARWYALQLTLAGTYRILGELNEPDAKAARIIAQRKWGKAVDRVQSVLDFEEEQAEEQALLRRKKQLELVRDL